jgi:hypothetical protein
LSEHDIQGISAIFLGLGIGVEFGKIAVISISYKPKLWSDKEMEKAMAISI